MKTTRLSNPFPVAAYHGSAYFCDREEETEKLLENALNGISTTLISRRRIGKTGLIHHACSKLPAGWKWAYTDILATNDLNEFFSQLTTAIYTAIPQKSTPGQKLWQLIKSMRPVMSFDPLTQAPQFSFTLQPAEVNNSIESLLTFLDEQEFNTLIAIDEFQQILNYPKKNADAVLRSYIQRLKKVRFIFSGSQQHLMLELFTLPSRPFFRSTALLKLSKLNPSVYQKFISGLFKRYKVPSTKQDIEEILEWTQAHTYFTQLLCNRYFAAGGATSPSAWKAQAHQLLKEQETVFFGYRSILTSHQWSLLKAMGTENRIYQPTAREFMEKHSLGTSSIVMRALNSLLNYDLVFYDFDEDGKKYYGVNDVLFQQWCRVF